MPKTLPIVPNPQICLSLRPSASQEALCLAGCCILRSSAVGNLRTVFRVNPWFITGSGALAAAGAIAYGAVHPRSQFFGRTICQTNSPRKLAITFDDGPNPAITPELLDLLDRYNAKATFFLIGRYVRECPELVKEIIARGHTVGNHTETHPNLLWLAPTQVRVELRLCHNAIWNAQSLGHSGGTRSRLPHGHVDADSGRLAGETGGMADSAHAAHRRPWAANPRKWLQTHRCWYRRRPLSPRWHPSPNEWGPLPDAPCTRTLAAALA